MSKKDVGVNLLLFGHQPTWKQFSGRVREKLSDVAGSKNILIRVERILELTQSILLYFVVGLMLGTLLDKIFPKYDPKESMAQNWAWAILQILANGFVMYYMEKLISVVPFLFHFYAPYTPNNEKHTQIGESIAISLVFFATQDNLMSRINAIQDKLNGKKKIP